MKKFTKYSSIGQFRNIVKDIVHSCSYVGEDEDGNSIFDASISPPILAFKGTVKIHGTNASVCYNDKEGFFIQSRNRVITIKKDNAGFAFFAESNKNIFIPMLKALAFTNNIDLSHNTISIFGEWAGKGIQRGVAISEVDRKFYVFAAKVTPHDEKDRSYYIEEELVGSEENNIYNINDFMCWYINVDFSKPELAIEALTEITNSVEKLCPVASHFGIKGVGEGVVWETNYKDSVIRFKVKGQKHSISKVKKLASVNVEQIKNIRNFVEYAVTENRFNQAIHEVFGGDDLDIRKLGDLIRWMVGDIIKEEMDTLNENNLTPKNVSSRIAQRTKEIFLKKQNKF